MAIYADFEIKKEQKTSTFETSRTKNKGNVNFLYFLLKLFMQYHECLSKKTIKASLSINLMC